MDFPAIPSHSPTEAGPPQIPPFNEEEDLASLRARFENAMKGGS